MGKSWVVALCLTAVTEVDTRFVHVLSTVSSPSQDYSIIVLILITMYSR